jgi:predicted enzyme related to lactoylglutathione lyase
VNLKELSMSKLNRAMFPFAVSLLFISIGGKAQNISVPDEPVQATGEQKKVRGIGGIFFKADDPKKIKEWYNKNLGLVTDEYGSMFEFRQSDSPEKKAYLQWSPFNKDTKYFEPSRKEFMINYRVENIEGLVEELRKNGVTIVDTIETYEYGKFVHILDPENNKIELWEPVDNEFTKSYEGKTTK